MKSIICFTILLSAFYSVTFSQSVMNYQTGTGVVVDSGADICADQVIMNGTYSGGGTICGGAAYELNLTALLQGFYNPSSNIMNSDTIIVYLRNAVPPFAKVDSSKGILNSSGTGTFAFSNITSGTNYYIVIAHRNSIETWSDSGKSFTNSNIDFDFTPAASRAFGNNMKQIDSSPLRFGIYSGDVNFNGSIDLDDIVLIYNDARSFLSGYLNTDVTGDNVVDLSDMTVTYNNAANFVGKIVP